jgi:hypothetical protein
MNHGVATPPSKVVSIAYIAIRCGIAGEEHRSLPINGCESLIQ